MKLRPAGAIAAVLILAPTGSMAAFPQLSHERSPGNSSRVPAADWPQLAYGPERLGRSPEDIDVPLEPAWAVGFAPERLHPQAQPVAAGGRVFVGTEMGTLHAFDAETGKRLWTFAAGGPILHSAAVSGTNVILAALDGRVHAVSAADGRPVWTFASGDRAGFSTAVLIAGGRTIAAARSGAVFALGAEDGRPLWRRDVGAPVLMSPSAAVERDDPPGGKVFVGSMDMRVRALDLATGRVLWTSPALPGAALKDYWPVAWSGYVLVRPARSSGWAWGRAIEWTRGPLPAEEVEKGRRIVEEIEASPALENLCVLDAATGRKAFTVPQWITDTMNGATAPPCVDGDGLLIVPVILHDWRGGWGRLDLGRREVIEVLCDGDLSQFRSRGYMRGTGNSDENLAVSAAGRLVFTFHAEETNAHFTGAWHLDRRSWTQVPPQHADRSFTSNTQGGGASPPAIAGGLVFHTSWNTLNARRARVGTGGPRPAGPAETAGGGEGRGEPPPGVSGRRGGTTAPASGGVPGPGPGAAPGGSSDRGARPPEPGELPPRIAAAAIVPFALRFDIVDAAGWRGPLAAEMPRSVTETCSRDDASDTVTVAVEFDRPGFAPLPPMLALAARYGFPVEFDRPPEDTGHASAIGPLAGFRGSSRYSWRVRGLGRYAAPPAAPGGREPPGDLERELESEVEKVLAAGHLRPWLLLVNVPGSGADDRGDVHFDEPGPSLAVLAGIVPLLRPALRDRLLAFLATERDAFPPEARPTVPYIDGAPREVNPHDPKLLRKWEEKVLAHRTRAAPGLFALYGLARFHEAVGRRPSAVLLERARAIAARSLDGRDWATLYWARGRAPAFNAVHGANRFFAGAVGLVRLARLAGDPEAEGMGWALLARAAAVRFAMGKHARFLHDSRQFNVGYGLGRPNVEGRPGEPPIRVETDPEVHEIPADPAWWVKARAGSWMGELVTWSWRTPLDDVRQVERLDETGADVWEWGGVDCGGTGQKRPGDREYWYGRTAPHLLPFRDLVPELALFLGERLRPEVEAFCGRVTENQPHWHAAYAEAILGAECGFASPADSLGLFLARAWALGDRPEDLAGRLDVPWLPRGDIYYIEKLGAAIRAYRRR